MATQSKNPFTWVEIYVEDMSRAQKFYEDVLQIEMIPMQTPGGFGDLEMVSFPGRKVELISVERCVKPKK